MLSKIRQELAEWISPPKRVEIRENWQATAEERVGEHSDKPFDHYAQYYATIDGEHCGIAFDIYVADVDGHAEPRINLFEETERWHLYNEQENPNTQIELEGE